MPISVRCNQCGKSLSVPDALAGQRGRCPCGNVVMVPTNGAIQPTPSAPMRSPVMAGSTGGYKGSVTSPEMFKKLFLGYLYCLVGTAVCGFLLFIMIMVAFYSAVSSISASVNAQMKYEQQQRQYESDLSMWEMNGGNGPKPVKPTPPPPPKASGGMATAFLVPVLYILTFLVSVAGSVFFFVFLYKAWDLIQDGRPQTTPGQAIGFMFIPFFNLYWYFIAVKGLCDDLNQYSRERGIPARQASPGMMIAVFVSLFVCYPVGLVLYPIGLNQIKNACMDIAAAKRA